MAEEVAAAHGSTQQPAPRHNDKTPQQAIGSHQTWGIDDNGEEPGNDWKQKEMNSNQKKGEKNQSKTA